MEFCSCFFLAGVSSVLSWKLFYLFQPLSKKRITLRRASRRASGHFALLFTRLCLPQAIAMRLHVHKIGGRRSRYLSSSPSLSIGFFIHRCCPVRATESSLLCSVTGSKEERLGVILLQVWPASTRSPPNILYTPVDNTFYPK